MLSTRHLRKTYGSTVAIENLDVEIPAGRVGLVGANGAGKTTLFRMFLGLARPTSGTVEVGGRNVAEDPVGIRARIGYMPEHDCLPLDQSAADVVATFGELAGLPARAARQRASDMLDLVGLDEARFRPVGTYSTGMRQRTKLAQALVADPEVVLLDEPTSGLDPSGRDEMLDLVARLGADAMSVVMSTHVLADVQRACDHVVMLDGGRLVVAGRTGTLLDTTGTVVVEVDGPVEALVAALRARGFTCAVSGSRVEVTAPDRDAVLDAIRDEMSDLGLPLNRLATRLTSLDEVFVRRATG
ncbi:MAG: ABC transporter ATP-binding protein [Actinomycetota bacterium]|nr:ABC transporter ATP-binding protein [Actinomycetota bacterium]